MCSYVYELDEVSNPRAGNPPNLVGMCTPVRNFDEVSALRESYRRANRRTSSSWYISEIMEIAATRLKERRERIGHPGASRCHAVSASWPRGNCVREQP